MSSKHNSGQTRDVTHWLAQLPVHTSLKSAILLHTSLKPVIEQALLPQPLDASTNASTQDGVPPQWIVAIGVVDATLTVVCTSSAVSTRLRHAQQSLLDAVNRAIDNNSALKQHSSSRPLNKLKVTVDAATQAHIHPERPEQRSPDVVSPAVIAHLQSAGQSLKDPDLASTLTRLASTLAIKARHKTTK